MDLHTLIMTAELRQRNEKLELNAQRAAWRHASADAARKARKGRS